MEEFSYSSREMTISREKTMEFVRFSLHRVTPDFHPEEGRAGADAIAGKPAPTVIWAAPKFRAHP
jgi:hypothetical protein